MSDNRMKYTIDSNMQFPLVEIALEAGESAYIQQGSMVYHTPSVTLNTKLNARGGSGFGKLMGPSVGQWYQANLCLSRKPFPIVTMENCTCAFNARSGYCLGTWCRAISTK